MSLSAALVASQLPAFPPEWQVTEVVNSASQLVWQLKAPKVLDMSLLPSNQCLMHQQQDLIWFCLTEDSIWSLTYQQEFWWLTKNLLNHDGRTLFLGIRGALVFAHDDNNFRFRVVRFERSLTEVVAAIKLRNSGYLIRIAEISTQSVQLTMRDPERYLQLQKMPGATLVLALEVKR